MKKPAILFSLIASTAFGQLPSDHYFMLQVLDADGNLIKKNEDATFSSQVWADDAELENQCNNPELNCYTVPYGTETVNYLICWQADTMRIEAGFAIETIAFSPGEFKIGQVYEELFKIKPGPKVSLLPAWEHFNQGIDWFINPLKKTTCISATKSDFESGIESWIVDVSHVKQTVAVAVEQDDPNITSLIYLTNNNGETWEQWLLPDSSAEVKNMELLSETELYVHALSNGDRYYHTTDGGASWNEVDKPANLAFVKEGTDQMDLITSSHALSLHQEDQFEVCSIDGDIHHMLLSFDFWKPVSVQYGKTKSAVLCPMGMVTSTNIATQWTYLPFDRGCYIPDFKGFFFLSDTTVCAYGANGVVFYEVP